MSDEAVNEKQQAKEAEDLRQEQKSEWYRKVREYKRERKLNEQRTKDLLMKLSEDRANDINVIKPPSLEEQKWQEEKAKKEQRTNDLLMPYRKEKAGEEEKTTEIDNVALASGEVADLTTRFELEEYAKNIISKKNI